LNISKPEELISNEEASAPDKEKLMEPDLAPLIETVITLV